MADDLLTKEQVSEYASKGQVGPIPLLDFDEVTYYRRKLEAAEAAFGKPLSQIPGQFRAKACDGFFASHGSKRTGTKNSFSN